MSATTASLDVPEASIRTGPTESADLAVVWARRAVTSSVLVMIVSLSTVDVTVGTQLSVRRSGVDVLVTEVWGE
ncbi:hypothetical protein [Curtobacterium sp. APC 4022]|uniref:hypothetical protein n=1 Tax=Curtobacterium sp. APC 4022 TaxID=3035201 RepID=UPI0025B5EF62|nr:hypothetical protein [Curtobacterium sp. APC 4022]MDN3479262.1 hypothetical protein [Curtobacterium sp. APC 4022]